MSGVPVSQYSGAGGLNEIHDLNSWDDLDVFEGIRSFHDLKGQVYVEDSRYISDPDDMSEDQDMDDAAGNTNSLDNLTGQYEVDNAGGVDYNDFLDIQEDFDDDMGDFDDSYIEDDDDMDNFDNASQNSASSSSKDPNMEGFAKALSEVDIDIESEDPTFPKFAEFPEEIQMRIWKLSAFQVRRTIVIELNQDSFKFANCPPLPGVMRACHKSRKYGLEVLEAVDVRGNSYDAWDSNSFRSFYFYINPLGDDFILRFGEESQCPTPTYCPTESSTSYMKLQMHSKEVVLGASEREYLLSRQEEAATAARNAAAHQGGHQFIAPLPQPHFHNTAGIAPTVVAPGFQNFFALPPAQNQNLAGPTLAALFAINNLVTLAPQQQQQQQPVLPPPPAGEPVFPPDHQLPKFFTNIRSIGINLELPFSNFFDFSKMSHYCLRNWAEGAVQNKFDTVFVDILDRFPKLEYAFAVLRAHGRSNRNLFSCHNDVGRSRRVRGNLDEREVEKKRWGNVSMTMGENTVMGPDECRQLEVQAKRWFMNQRIGRGFTLLDVEFELYVQRSLEWDI